jgi:hypothetical protein
MAAQVLRAVVDVDRREVKGRRMWRQEQALDYDLREGLSKNPLGLAHPFQWATVVYTCVGNNTYKQPVSHARISGIPDACEQRLIG